MCTRTRAKAPQSHSESCWSHLAEDLLRVVLILAFMAYKLCVCVCLSSMSYFTPRKFLNPTRAIYIYIYVSQYPVHIYHKQVIQSRGPFFGGFFSCEQVKRLGFLVTSSYRTCFGPAEGWHRLAAEATGELLKALTNLQQIAAALHKGIDLEKDATFLDAKDVGSQVRICEFLC